MQKYLKLFVILLSSAGTLYCAEPRMDLAEQGPAKKVPRMHSPLANETTQDYVANETTQNYEVPYNLADTFLFDDGANIAPTPAVLVEPSANKCIRLKNSMQGYELGLKLAPIAKSEATVVINTYNSDVAQPKVSVELFKGAGKEFVKALREFFKNNQALFTSLKASAGSSYVLPTNKVGNLSIGMMALMYIPECYLPEPKNFRHDKNDPTLKSLLQFNMLKQADPTLKTIHGNLLALLTNLFNTFRQKDIWKASIVLPALGADQVFKDYPRQKMATMIAATVFHFLRYVYSTQYDAVRLESVNFVVDSQEAYEHYAQAFRQLYETGQKNISLQYLEDDVNN